MLSSTFLVSHDPLPCFTKTLQDFSREPQGFIAHHLANQGRSDSLLRCWALIVNMWLSRVRERKATVALESRSISQDRLWYCYWCCYLVWHNWILKYNITHSSCWGFDISISLLMHIQVDVVKCECIGERVRGGGVETCGWTTVLEFCCCFL